MKHIKLFHILLFFLVASCKRVTIVAPPAIDHSNLAGTRVLSMDTMKKMEGIYRLAGGNKDLGLRFVCTVSRSRVSFFSEKDGIYIILKHGYNIQDGSVRFSGFWRYTKKKEQGSITFSIPAAAAVNGLLSGAVNGLLLQGSVNGEPISFRFEHPFTARAIGKNFIVIAHRGVQTDSDPPFAENSLNAVLNVEQYGVNGMEIDVRMTQDHIPICVHDEKINSRTMHKGSLSGKWDDHSFQAISDQVRLVDGQKIPTVEQALNAFIDSTNLTYLWLDIKGNKDIFKYLEPLIRNAYARAAAQNRQVVLFAGIPSDEVVEQLHAQPGYAGLPTLFEQNLDLVINNGGAFYGPRYSEGLHLDEVAKAHSKGIKVICWTLNKEKFIRKYLEEGQFDGFVTDNPSYVLYNFYTMF
jgi:glycerophosphoryl diester phosphodiesterase